METDYSTLIIKSGKSIAELNEIFEDTVVWGVSTLKERMDCYESTRFTQIDDHTAVITSEYNMELVVEWLQKNLPITELKYVKLCAKDITAITMK